MDVDQEGPLLLLRDGKRIYRATTATAPSRELSTTTGSSILYQASRNKFKIGLSLLGLCILALNILSNTVDFNYCKPPSRLDTQNSSNSTANNSSSLYFDGHYIGNLGFCNYDHNLISEFTTKKSIRITVCDTIARGPQVDIRHFVNGTQPTGKGITISPRDFRLLFTNKTVTTILRQLGRL